MWEAKSQPAARWHSDGEGPAQYFADTPGGAWAEFLRHEEITEEVDLAGVDRAIWAVEVGSPDTAAPDLPDALVRGGYDTYTQCQQEAARLRDEGVAVLRARSAALEDGGATGWRVEFGFRKGPTANGYTYVFFGAQPGFVGWLIVDMGQPPAGLLQAIRHF